MGKEKQNFTLHAKILIRGIIFGRMAIYKYKNTPCFFEKLHPH
uniref:Uncharacterized protein n=1 Tax=Wuchereria bancrofti TaxID=6293 RepID=A0AAF5PKV3_WUCBA